MAMLVLDNKEAKRVDNIKVFDFVKSPLCQDSCRLYS